MSGGEGGGFDRYTARDDKWCGQHRPSKPGLCVVHGQHLQELHDEELKKIYGVEAIFYCQEAGCDDFCRDTRGGTHHIAQHFLKNRVYPAARNVEYNYAITKELKTVIMETFRNAARLKILFHKSVMERQKKMTSLETPDYMYDGFMWP